VVEILIKYFRAAGNLSRNIQTYNRFSCKNLEKRSKEYEEIFEKFSFLESIHALDHCEITKQCEKLANIYNKGLNSEELTSECLHFKSYIKLDMKSLME
jgi:hypothetical protein